MIRSIASLAMAIAAGALVIFSSAPVPVHSANFEPGTRGTRLVQAKAPELTEIAPTSGPAGAAYPIAATIRGSGFTPTGNVIEFGPVKIPDVPSSDGVRLTFHVPKERASTGEVPPMVLPPGQYRVTVTTAVGTSNALMFELKRGL